MAFYGSLLRVAMRPFRFCWLPKEGTARQKKVRSIWGMQGPMLATHSSFTCATEV